MHAPIKNSDELFDLYSKYEKKIKKNEVVILIDQKTRVPRIIEQKTGDMFSQITQSADNWFSTSASSSRKIEKELVKAIRQEFKEMKKEIVQLAKKIKKGTPDEELSQEIQQKMKATLQKLEEHKKLLPSIKEKYEKPWGAIIRESKKLIAYGELIAKRSQIAAATTPETRIQAIHSFFQTIIDYRPALGNQTLAEKFSKDNQNLHLQDLLISSKQELYQNIESGIKNLEKAYLEGKGGVKAVKEMIYALPQADEKKAGYLAEFKEFEERFEDFDYNTLINARSLVENWNQKKRLSEMTPINMRVLKDFLTQAELVFNSPLANTVQEMIGKDEVRNVLQAFQEKLLEASQESEGKIEQNKRQLESMTDYPSNITAQQRLGKEKLEALNYKNPVNLQGADNLVAESEKAVSSLKAKADALQKIVQELEEQREEKSVIKEAKEKVINDYIKSDPAYGKRPPSKVQTEFNNKYSRYQKTLNSIQEEIKLQNNTLDPETVRLEDLLTPYLILEKLLEKKLNDWNEEITKNGVTKAKLPEDIAKLAEEVSKNSEHVESLKKAIKIRDIQQQGSAGRYLQIMRSLDKEVRDRPEHLIEVKGRHQEAIRQYNVANQELEVLKAARNDLKKAKELQNSLNELKAAQATIEQNNIDLQEQINSWRAALKRLKKLQEILKLNN